MADVNLSIEVQNRGVQEATAAIERLSASGRSASKVVADIVSAVGTLNTALAGSRVGLGTAKTAMGELQKHVGKLREEYSALGSVMVGATASERLKNWGGTLDQGIARARLLKQQMEALNSNPIRDLMAVEQARASRLVAQGNLEKARWNASLQGMTAAQRATAQLTRAENEYAAAARAAAAAETAKDAGGGRFRNKATGHWASAPTDAEIRAEAKATEELARTTNELSTARGRLRSLDDQAGDRRASARARLSEANWERELAGMSQAEAVQARLTRATNEYTAAKLRANAATSLARKDPSIDNINAQADALDNLANKTRALTSLQQTQQHESDNAFQSSYSYFILAGLAQQATQALVGLGTAAVTASRETERAFADTRRTFEGTDAQLGRLQGRLRELSTETPVSIIDLTEIATLGNQLGIAANDIEKFTQVIAQYTAVSGVSAEDAATAFGRISNLTGIAASEYDKLASAITYTARTTVATESSIQSTAKEITALASGAGFSASAIVGLAGALSSLAIPPERARGALSLYFGALNTAVSEGGPKLKAFAELTNMTTQELDSLVRSNQGEKVFTSFINGLSDLDTVAKTDALKTLGLGTIRVDQTMRALAQNVPLVTKSLDGAHNAYAAGTDIMNQYGIIQETLDSKIKKFQNALFNAAAAAGENGGLVDSLKKALDAGTEFIVFLTEVSNTPAGKAFLTVATAAMLVVTALSALIGALSLAKASMVVTAFALKGLDFGGSAAGIKIWAANLLGGSAAANGTAAATTRLAASNMAYTGSTRVASASQTALNTSLVAGTATANGASVAMRGLSAAMRIAWPILAITAAVAGINAVMDAADKAINPVKNLGAGVDSLKQAIMDDNIALMASGIENIGTGVRKANPELSSLNNAILAAIDTQKQAEEQIGKTNGAISSQRLVVGDATSAWIESALKESEAIQDLIKGRSTWDNIRNLGMSPKMIADLNPGALANGMLKSTDVLDTKEFEALLANGLPLAELSKVAAEKGSEVAKEQYKAWASGLAKEKPDLADAADRFGLGVLPNLLAGVEDGVRKARMEAALAKSSISATGEVAASSAGNLADLRDAAATAGETSAFAFEGATDRLDDFRKAISGAMQEYVGFSAVTSRAGELLKKISDNDDAAFGDGSVLPSIEIEAWGQSLTAATADANTFYNNITQLAATGSQALALGFAEMGPEAAGLIAGALELGPEELANLEVSARMAGFLASDAYLDSLRVNMASSEKAYSAIFDRTGSLDKVREYIAAQVAGTGAEWERQWAMENPDLPLNVTPELKDPTPEQISTWQALAEGKITVKATIKPGSDSMQEAMRTDGDWIQYLDSATGATITLPANLDDATLSASLAIWRENQNATPSVLQGKIDEAGLTNSVRGWEATAPTLRLNATVKVTVPYLPQIGIDAIVKKPGGGYTGGLIDKQRYGDDKFPRFATGGGYKVTGPGSGISDSILARLSAGEYVNTKKSVDFWGADFFDSLNRRMLPASMMKLFGAAMVSGNQSSGNTTNVSIVQQNPVTRDPLKQLREDSERVAAGIWG